MLFRRPFLEGVRSGRLRLAFRRWARAGVRPGTVIRTALGSVRVVTLTPVSQASISERDAHLAGFDSLDELLADLDTRAGQVFRVEIVYAGPDGRVALRKRGTFPVQEWNEIRAELSRIDAASRRGPWTLAALGLLAEQPGIRAADLAPRLKRETQAFKRDIRVLKEMGLTESLEVGYRLSPRGRAVLSRLRRPPSPPG